MDSASRDAIRFLRSPASVRERCHAVLEAGLRGELSHFSVELGRLDVAADLTWEVTSSAYPDLEIPVHSRVNHLRIGGVDRVGAVEAELPDARERARTLTELIVTSVLLDAGAGPDWCFVEPGTGLRAGRSEGLALASYHAFAAGAFSSDPTRPLRADSAGLGGVTAERLARAFQVRDDNPLVGLEGRAALLTRLGSTVAERPEFFAGTGRVGGLCDGLVARAHEGTLSAEALLSGVLEALAPIWPSRFRRFGVDWGDVWPHPAAGGTGPTSGLVPFHKLSQWLSYSLLYPLAVAGVTLADPDGLTGLAEYRNGGLFYDTGVIVAKHSGVERDVHLPGSEVVVEWRALTVALLDRIAERVRRRAGLTAERLPLGKILEGGTWAAGRRLAAERRRGLPPIRVQSDGTLF
jgi:hypothetical protein